MIGGFAYLTDSRHNGVLHQICDYISITTWKAKLPQAEHSSFSKQYVAPGKDAEFLMKYFIAIAIHIALECTAAFESFCMNT